MLAKLSSSCPFVSRLSAYRRTQKYQLHQLADQISTTSQKCNLEKDYTWTSLLSELGSGGQNLQIALREASQLVSLTRACAKSGLFAHGEQLHCHVLKSGFNSNVFLSTALINFYVKFELVLSAHHLFDEISEPSVVSWNSLITGYVHSGQFRKALELFCQLEKSNLSSDSYSFTAALSGCGHLSLVHVGMSLHSKIVKYGVECSVVVANCLIDMYGKCGHVAEAMQIFQAMVDKDVISWNSVLAANARNGKLEQAFVILHQMPEPDTISYNELIDGIARFGVVEDAIVLLSKMENPNSSSWNSIITGYVNRSRGREALEFFCKMHSSGAPMDEFTFSSIFSGIASLSCITWGISTHCCALKNGLEGYVVVGSALIDMYFKCGKVNEAEKLFHSLPNKNIVTWNAVISGHAHNGNSQKVIELFEELKTRRDYLKPDEITFLNVFSACWHSRIPLKVAKKYFESMIFEYMIDPLPEHCCLMIRLMGQEGDVSKAEEMINELGYDCCGMVWKTLLGACLTCADIEVAELAAKKVMELEGDRHNEFVYIMMSNIYACHGKWEDVRIIRNVMKERKIRKEVGLSWIQVD